jgi:hypothetical protein
MSMPISKFWSPTKQGKIYAGILSVIVVLVSWFMAINSLVEIPWENLCVGKPSGCAHIMGDTPMVTEIKTDYMNLYWGLLVGSTYIICILFSSLYFKNRKQGNRPASKVNLEVRYYLFLYFAFLIIPILFFYKPIVYGSDLSFMSLVVELCFIVSLVVVLLVSVLGFCLLNRSTKNKHNTKPIIEPN